MLIDYLVKSKYGSYLVIFRNSTGVYEIWQELNPKKHVYISSASNFAQADAIAKQCEMVGN